MAEETLCDSTPNRLKRPVASLARPGRCPSASCITMGRFWGHSTAPPTFRFSPPRRHADEAVEHGGRPHPYGRGDGKGVRNLCMVLLGQREQTAGGDGSM